VAGKKRVVVDVRAREPEDTDTLALRLLAEGLPDEQVARRTA